MPLKRRKEKNQYSKVLGMAQTSTDRLIEDDIVDELTRTGVVWSGLLGLENAIHPSDVAAMISSYELVKATRFVDSEAHWAEVASFAAVGSFCDTEEGREEESRAFDNDEEHRQFPIGFSSDHAASPGN